MSTIYLSLGTNVGDRWQSLRAAVAALDGFIEIDAVSPVYETAPWGPIREQPRFLNCCVSGRSELAPELLLVALRQLEKRVGAQQARRFGPRTIDIDLLAMGRVTLQYRHWHLPKRQIARPWPFACPHPKRDWALLR